MISIIIPVLNEQKTLPATLHGLLGQGGEFEIIVADGGSTDDTVELAKAWPGVDVLTAAAGRASQMNAAARAARGEWLLFLHADTQLPAGALARLNGIEHDLRIQAGGFRHRFTGSSRSLRLISWINNHRCRHTRVFYGDQAPFVRRALFEKLGGFPDQPILEDVLLGERLTRVTEPVLLDCHALTDSRRFIEQGIWRSFARVFLIMGCHKLGLPIPATKFFAVVR